MYCKECRTTATQMTSCRCGRISYHDDRDGFYSNPLPTMLAMDLASPQDSSPSYDSVPDASGFSGGDSGGGGAGGDW